jgi:phospholipid/cholesterol/gamma-HCH transport system ATP-binding protein
MTDTDLDRTRDRPAAARSAVASGSPARMEPVRDVIRFEDVHFWQGALKVLDGVSFGVPEGKISVVLGPSGTGKSTLLWLILGLWKPDAGRILIGGEDTTAFDERKWKDVRQGLSMVFQENALFDSLTVAENVAYCLLRTSDLSDTEIERVVREMLQLVELDPDRVMDRAPDQLSGGQKRRVAIARAIANCNPEVILYDEPTTGLDPQTARTVGDLILKLRDTRGSTSVVVTHEIGDALRIGDRFLMLQGGKLVFDGTSSELLACTESRVQEFLDPYLRTVEELGPRIEAVR